VDDLTCAAGTDEQRAASTGQQRWEQGALHHLAAQSNFDAEADSRFFKAIRRLT